MRLPVAAALSVVAVVSFAPPLPSVSPRRVAHGPHLVLRSSASNDSGSGGGGDWVKITRVLGALAVLPSDTGAEAASAGRWELDAPTGCWVLNPTVQPPKAIVHFLGGAGFGAYPRVAYGQLLGRLCASVGGGRVAVVAGPVTAGLDHDGLAAASAAAFDDVSARRQGWKNGGGDSGGGVVLRVGHSLGAKLHALNLATGRYPRATPLALVAFNNFGLGESAGLALSFAEAFAGSGGGGDGGRGRSGAAGAGVGGGSDFLGMDASGLRALADFAAVFTASLNLEFSPSPGETRALLASFAASSEQQQQQRRRRGLGGGVRVSAFRFDGDALDSSGDLAPLLRASASSGIPGRGGGATALPGTHLAPVYLHASVRDLANRSGNEVGGGGGVSPGTRRALDALLESGLIDDSGTVSFGDESALGALVTALAQWVRHCTPGI